MHTFAPPTLYIFSGLPGTGKTTLSQRLAKHLGAVHLRIDTLEQALRDLCRTEVHGEGYALAYRIASDNLHLGISVVADSCNPIELTRQEWAEVARSARAFPLNFEIVCTDQEEHRRRVESRPSTVPGLALPTWEEVARREFHSWTTKRIVLDTAGKSETESFYALLTQLPREGQRSAWSDQPA